MTADSNSFGVFCNNLSWESTEADLRDFIVDEAGRLEIDNVVMLKDGSGRAKGSAMVYLKSAADAETVVAKCSDKELGGRRILVREDRDPTKIPGANTADFGDDELKNRQVFVGNLAWQTTWRSVKDHMMTVGEVEFCATLTGKDGRPNGSALVRFSTEAAAKEAMSKLSDTDLDGRQIFVREDREGTNIDQVIAKGKGKGKGKGQGKGKGKARGPHGEYALHVSGISKRMSWQDLKDAFTDYEPSHADVGEFRGGENRGFGVVKFAHREDAEEALHKMDGTSIDGFTISIKWDRDSA